MKKRTVKDFIALYAPEDEEKLVLIQDGVSADKTFLDTYWAAHTHALAMADVQTGQAISGRCYLSWPLTDKERDAGDYSKQFTKGQIYRIKARGWKGDALYEPQWYVTEVLEEGVPCPALEEIWAEYTKPILLEDEVLGTLTLDREMSIFEGTCKWMGKEVRISLDVEIEKKASWTRVTNVMKKLVADQETWDKSLRAMAAQKLIAQANEWLADNNQTARDPKQDPITEDEFARRILLTEFTVSPGGRFTAWYEDDDMFWGHVITVDGTLKKGPVDADIMEKHIGSTECFCYDKKMAGFAAQEHIAEFKDGKCPVQLMVMKCDKFKGKGFDAFLMSQMWDCQEDRERIFRECKYQVVATDMLAAALPALERANLDADFLEALAELYPTCEAFYFQNCGKLFLAEDVRSHQIEGSDRFIRFGVNVRFFNIEGTEDMLIDTVGMSTLLLPDLQYHFHGMDPNWVVNHAYNVASYILEHDNPIQDGETIDGVADGQMCREIQWKCQYEDALIQPPRGVLDINMGKYASGGR